MGTLIAKALSPFVTQCDLGVTTRAPSAELSGREGTDQVVKSEM